MNDWGGGMHVCVVGGGLYGCHIAATLKSFGITVTLVEARERLLDGASGNNQFRLHQGFHYARSFPTRLQSRDGFHRFKERYPRFSRPIARNLYAIVEGESYVDFRTYRGIMSGSGLDFTDEGPSLRDVQGVEGALSTPEEVLMIGEMRTHFERVLNADVQFGVAADVDLLGKSGEFDWVIDCTWGHSGGVSGVFYEPTVLLYYECLDVDMWDWSLTLVDGPFWSLYQTEVPGLFTLSSVPHSPLGAYDRPESARQRYSAVTAAEIETRRRQFEKQAIAHFPTLLEKFVYAWPQLSIKTKPYGRADHRHCEVKKDGNVIRVLSGKIDTVFYASGRVLEIVEQGGTDGIS